MSNQNAYLENAWKEYNKKLLYFIRSHVRSPEDAEDILADVYLKLAQQVDTSRKPEKLTSWLFSVTRNTIITFYRKKKPVEPTTDYLLIDIPDPQVLTALSDCVLPIIEEIPELYRLPILLSEVHGKKQKAVAKELRLSLPAVKSRILRGRKKLGDMMSMRCRFQRDENGQLIDYSENT
jgi:RNA polymerase sigma-70 factor (ECF subfamily)